MTKRCCTCKEVKLYEQFARHKNRADGFNDQCKECRRAYNQKNKERLNQYARMNYHENRDARLVQSKQWHEENRTRVNELHISSNHKRRVELSSRTDSDVITLWELFERDQGICGICKMACTEVDATIDHIQPISKGGFHTWNNVQLAHGMCNFKKGNRV